MAKKKNKKVSSEVIHSKKVKARKQTQNLFEVHINKEKLRILGKKQKNDKGLPGVSRAKAIQKRKTTLLQEYKLQNKANKFYDKRIGEKNHDMTEEDKSLARFAIVRVKEHSKKSIFNLADDEVLTHCGQALSEIERFDDPKSDDESLEDETGKLNSDFVGSHFGGGLLKKTNSEGLSHKDLILQLITDSKKRKAEQQKMKEATLELTEQLDTEWKDLIPLVNQKKSKEVDHQKNYLDDYDKLTRELKFAARGTVSDSLKTDDEIAKAEKEKLENLEQERILRMKGGIKDSQLQPSHRSADDIDDIFYEEINDYMLSYNKEGKSNINVLNTSTKNEIVNNRKQSDDELSDGRVSENEDNDTNASEDSLSDLKNDSFDDDCDEKISNKDDQILRIKESKSDTTPVGENQREENTEEDKMKDLLKRKLMENAIQELPFTFALPESYESMQKLLEKQLSTHQSVIIDRMIKCNHHSIAKGNKDKLSLLFAYLLQYLNNRFEDCADNSYLKESFEIFNALVPRLYELAQINPENAHHSLLEVIKEKHEDYKRQFNKYPGLELLIFLKLISILLPTSDFRHQVITPCFIFIEQLLTKCKVQSMRDISYGLFIVTLFLEFTVISKRFLPAAINFLSGILHMAIPKTGVKLIKVLPPFKKTSSLLVLTKNFSSGYSDQLRLEYSYLLNMDMEESYKIRVLYASLKILEEFHTHFKDLPSCVEIFNPVLKYLEAIPMNYYPELVKNAHEHLLKVLKNSSDQRKLPYIVMQAMKPKALRMYEPKIEEIFERRRHKLQSKDKTERDKLLYKLKKESKGALREIRRDNNFLGRVKIHQQIKSDKERSEKVKRIYAEAASQQSELNALDRKTKRKK